MEQARREAEYQDFSQQQMQNWECRFGIFRHCRFDGADLTGADLSNALFADCSFVRTVFRGARLQGTTLRGDDLRGADIRGADLYAANLEGAELEGVVHDQTTRWFDLYCPAEGAFLGYKKCVNDRLVQLLIPAAARRSSATLPSCRCDRAKVLTIKSFDYRQHFTEAWSLVNEDFVYRVGEWVAEPAFNEDRFMDSAAGIHFWLTREEAWAY